MTPIALAVAVVSGGCAARGDLPAEGHLLIRIDTDAVLPSSTGTAGVFDSATLEVLDPAGHPACNDCAREVGLTREDVERGATFVVRGTQPAVLRARLFDSRHGVVARDAAVVIEHWMRLPASPAEGELSFTVTLPLERVGQPLGSLEAPTEPGAATARLPAGPVDVELTPSRPSEVCVPGGLFWMGDPRLPSDPGEPAGAPTARVNVPVLVHVASFCVDAHEVTVGELRASGVSTADVVTWSGTTDTSNLASFCAFTKTQGVNDERAVNCVPWGTARSTCRARGMDLPTEAQLEYLGTALGRSSFVWGHDAPACDEAYFARAVAPIPGDASCTGSKRGAVLPASADMLAATRDVLVLPNGTVTGLGSNLSEWTREEYTPRADLCHGPRAGFASDPECVATPSAARIAVRGGNLMSPPAECAAALRASVAPAKLRVDLGFRCVR